MKYLKQFCIIAALAFLGEILNRLIPLPIPASIYGLLAMLLGLSAKIIKIEAIKETAAFLIEIMPVMFIPAAVGLSASWDILKPNLLPYIVTTFLSTFVVMGAAGHVAQYIVRRRTEKKERISKK